MTTPVRLPFPITLSGNGVILREWRPEDLNPLVELLDDADIARFTPMTSPFDREAGEAYLARAKQARTTGQRIQLAITVDGGEPLGEVLLFGMDVGLREAELGYLIGARHRRRGARNGGTDNSHRVRPRHAQAEPAAAAHRSGEHGKRRGGAPLRVPGHRGRPDPAGGPLRAKQP